MPRLPLSRVLALSLIPLPVPRRRNTSPDGIVLPDAWPPARTAAEVLSGEPMPLPYLQHPPPVIPIDLGRQLFIDDFLIESTTLTRSFHPPAPLAAPVLTAEKPWEIDSEGAWAGASRTVPV